MITFAIEIILLSLQCEIKHSICNIQSLSCCIIFINCQQTSKTALDEAVRCNNPEIIKMLTGAISETRDKVHRDHVTTLLYE